MEANLLIDGVFRELSGAQVNRTFTCNKHQQWIDLQTNEVVDSVECVEIPIPGNRQHKNCIICFQIK